MINKTPKKKNKLDYQNIKTELNIRNYCNKNIQGNNFFLQLFQPQLLNLLIILASPAFF